MRRKAIKNLGYKGSYRGVFPIKVNQQQQVIEEIADFGSRYHHGLEVGSKGELIAAVSHMTDREACLICNGDAPKYWPMNQKLYRAAYQFAPHLNHMKFPASVFCVDDYTANRLYRAAHDAGLQIGSDLMVVGFDDLPFARRLTPPLATIRVDSRKLGFLAAKLLHRAVINSFSSPVHMKVPAEFIERKSLYISKEGS